MTFNPRRRAAALVLCVSAVSAGGALHHDFAVDTAENNEVFGPALLPNDPQFTSQWHLATIHAPQAWDITQGAPAAVIAIVDSGVDPHHPDLAGKLVPGYNSYDKSGNTADQFGHGTKMAGVAGARSNNGVGIAGVAGLSPIMPIRATDRAGRASSASIAKGIVWAVDHGARVVNISLQGVVKNAAIRTAAEYAFNHGALVVAPSGNCGCDEATPGSPFILSVSATDETDNAAYFSTTGAFVDISAPGANITTTTMYGLYLGDSGTSLASSVVAGVAALMFSANPALTPAVVKQLLQTTAFNPGGKGHDPRFGHGRVDAFAAVSAALAYEPVKSGAVATPAQ
jgi:thermitase